MEIKGHAGNINYERVLVLGAGGHAKVVADILLLSGMSVLGFLDDDPQLTGGERLGLPVLGTIDQYARYAPDGLVMGIGSNQARHRIVKSLGVAAQPLWLNAIHPRASVAASAVLGTGVVIATQAAVTPDSVIGDHVIINTGASADHDCRVGDFVHIGPGARLAGGVSVGEGAFIATGASVIPEISIGAWSTVGAGAAVVRDVPAQVKAYGVPAVIMTSDLKAAA